MAKIVKLLGAHCCESYVLKGNEKGHALRSDGVEFANGEKGVRCIFCGTALPTLINTLVSQKFPRVLPVDQSSAHQYQFQFNYGDTRQGEFVYVVVTFDSFDKFSIKPTRIGRKFDAAQFGSLPPVLAKIAKNLEAVDFRVIAPRDLDEFHSHNLRTITLWRGRRLIKGKPALDGVRVTLNYIV